jgi:hypothetical protein
MVINVLACLYPLGLSGPPSGGLRCQPCGDSLTAPCHFCFPACSLLPHPRSAEFSYTHRHLCEFTGLDLEMQIHEHYFEVCEGVG